jgi:hypothetical protein
MSQTAESLSGSSPDRGAERANTEIPAMANVPEDDDRYHSHLLTLLQVSAAMVGVCLTGIGLVSILKSLQKLEMVVDNLLAVGAVLFMGVTLLSFLGIRTRIRKKWHGYSLALDILFCLGLATGLRVDTGPWVVI